MLKTQKPSQQTLSAAIAAVLLSIALSFSATSFVIAQTANDAVEEVRPDEKASPETNSETDEDDTNQSDANTEKPEDSNLSNFIPNVITDLDEVPFPVRKMRELILTAARSGDIEKLRPYLGYGDDVTMLSLGGFNEDPIEFLRSLSGDAEGHEILAIMTEILEAPFVKIEEENGEALYVWPYFYSYPFDALTPEQRVQLFRIITYGDYEEMLSFGSYIFYRLGITPQGRWRFFVAGD